MLLSLPQRTEIQTLQEVLMAENKLIAMSPCREAEEKV
jgi:hypothetical protein